MSHTWKGYGTFGIAASVNVDDVAATRAAIAKTLTDLRAAPVDADVLQRARQPLVEHFQNGLKSNEGWAVLVSRAQSESDRIARYIKAKDRLQAIDAKALQAAALRYLDPAVGLEVLVLPGGVKPPAP